MATAHPEILLVNDSTDKISCNGNGGTLGHPKVYYSFDNKSEIICGYCDRLFTKENQHGATPYKGAV